MSAVEEQQADADGDEAIRARNADTVHLLLEAKI
jgi:hypothetical protein